MLDVQQLFRRYNSDLKRYLRRRGASAETAADLTQETFLRLLTASPLGHVDNVQAYIFRTANNLSIDLARRQRLLPFLDDGEEVLDKFMDETPSPERVVVSRQELAILQTALNQVPQTPRNVFLARLDGRTFEEIGRAVGIPTQTAFSQMVRVMMHLRAALDRARE
ncbi:RNA polymerase sigma factor [Bradyrhizobium sp. G127]|jgi:RNA polymerase sigma-70 factor (ECF subfamily)|uniref:RNA polymerase sigma factor n=1 Tax=Bradyrhizobium sp. G127 TaxID=2904800 RepID=UPI001F218959|nr:RNA polymerase sigma factor [Bradyrhizobium sp. G127]MCF2524942.1 RNA polymerase sigma factor [Bradyrhizobium sp. G127]